MLVTREELERHEREALAPYACLAAESRGRVHPEPESRYRTAFQKDRDRVLTPARSGASSTRRRSS